MNASMITKRDLEILRTLVRVQLARTGSLQEAFFRTLATTRRRLRVLRSYGLVDTHCKGLPGNLAASGGQYWRITEQGLRLFMSRFPNESAPENLIARTLRASLRCFEHRDDMTNLYLRLVASGEARIEDVSARAETVNWLGEYEVVLEYQGLDNGARLQTRRIIPDATLTTEGTRYFLEVDRSTESRKRCKRAITAYAKVLSGPAYRERFPDQLPVVVVYSTKSRARAKSLSDLIGSIGKLPMQVVALPGIEMTDWLNGMVSQTPERKSGRPDEAKSYKVLRGLYDAYRKEVMALRADGVKVSAPPAMLEAYEFLEAHEREAVMLQMSASGVDEWP